MKWFKWRCRRKNQDEETPMVPTEKETREARAKAEKEFRETTDRWSEVHEVSAIVERVRERTGPDPFVDELARAMRARTHHREA